MLQDGQHDEASVRSTLETFRPTVDYDLSDEDLDYLCRKLAEQLNIDVDLGTAITAEDFEPWLKEKKRDIEWERWAAYRTLMLRQGRSPKVIDKLDDLTDDILDFAGDPTVGGSWNRRGLVLGDVQSGKTATYLGLFNKAADAGYRLVILLAGNTEVLRRQTQARVDEAFIGRDTARQGRRTGADTTPSKHIGIGLIRKDLAHTVGMTTVLRDFRKSSYEASSITLPKDAAHPFVFVLKKNKSVLSAVQQWLEEQAAAYGGVIHTPLLLLDDESDYASINTREDSDPTAINKAIRDILSLFARSSYVAFTATPFANIFMDHGVDNDLFPKDFVYSLEAPSNYVGSTTVFGTTEDVKTDRLHLLDDVDDLIPLRHKSELVVPALPASLKEAVRTFFVANAIRDLRGQTDQPRAMLVNVSRFKRVQAQVHDLLQEEVTALNNAVQLHCSMPGSRHREIERLRRAYEAHFADTGTTWDEVRKALPQSVSDVRVQLFNSDRDKALIEEEELSWERPPRMVAVGGDVLSRGLTLEGLSTSYFYRAVTASDTLMQMARWFGYRDGYQDLCHLWINHDSADNYRLAAESIEDLRLDLRLMLRQKLTPEHFGLAVKKHPTSLLITARNKMRNTQSATKVVSLAGRRLETTRLNVDPKVGAPEKNRLALTSLLEAVLAEGTKAPTPVQWPRWQGVPRTSIADFLENYVADPGDPFFSDATLSGWVRRARAIRFATWDVVIAKGHKSAKRERIGGTDIPIPRRELVRAADRPTLRVSGARMRLAGPSDVASLLPSNVREQIETEFREEFPEKKGVPETRFYKALERPVLMIYLLQPPDDDQTIGNLVAVKVAIPGDSTDPRNSEGEVEYVINTVAQQQWLTEFTGADDEDIDD